MSGRETMMKIYGYFRSSASYRVRIALNLKGLACETESIHLNRDGGQQFSAAYRALNPAALVPTLTGGGIVVDRIRRDHFGEAVQLAGVDQFSEALGGLNILFSAHAGMLPRVPRSLCLNR